MLEPPVRDFDIQPTQLTLPWWDALKENRLTVQRCTACGRSFFRPEVACSHCFSTEWRWVDSSGLGTLYSFSTIHRSPTPAFASPFIFAAIDLDEGWSMFSNLIGVVPEEVRIGMRVAVSFEKLEGGRVVPLFRPHV